LLATIFVGFGSVFVGVPTIVNRLGGQFLPDSREVRLLIRLLGMRDISLGVGLFLAGQQNNKESTLVWRRIMAFNTGTDVLLLSLFLPTSKIKPKVFLAWAVSLIATVLTLLD
jgi:hypothetical protein